MNQYDSQLIKVMAIIKGVNPENLGITNLKQNKLSNSQISHQVWESNLVKLVAFLDELEIDYVLMKYVSCKYAIMKDIDLLIERNCDIKKLFARLSQMKFKLYSKEIKRSDKATLLGNFDPNSMVEVDIYVSPALWMINYAPAGLISNKKIKREIGGKIVSLPSPSHSIFMIATHTYWHGCLTFSEIAEIGKTIMTEEIIWDDLLSLARAYHLEHPLYLNLFLVNDMLKLTNSPNAELQNAVNKLKESNINKLLLKAVLNANTGFPFRIPYKFKLTSAFDEVLQSFVKRRITYQEFESYFYALLLGRKIHW
jgi:hypothetical protein